MINLVCTLCGRTCDGDVVSAHKKIKETRASFMVGLFHPECYDTLLSHAKRRSGLKHEASAAHHASRQKP